MRARRHGRPASSCPTCPRFSSPPPRRPRSSQACGLFGDKNIPFGIEGSTVRGATLLPSARSHTVALDERAKRDALRMLPHPVFIVGCSLENNYHLFVGTWLTQVSFRPPLVGFGCRKESGSHEMIRKSGVFSINILDKTQKDVAAAFLKGAAFKGKTVNGLGFNVNG